MNHQGQSCFPVGNQDALLTAIIINRCRIRQRQIQVPHVPKSCLESPEDDIGRDGMAAFAHPPCHTSNRKLWRRKPKVIVRNSPPLPPASFKHREVRPFRASRLKCKTSAVPHKRSNLLNHLPSGCDRCGLHIRWRKPARNFVCVQKWMQDKELRKQNPCCGCLPCPIRTAQQNDFFHTHSFA